MWKRELSIFLLGVLSISTSLTLVIDAGEWYGSLYRPITLLGIDISAQFRGVVFALILESFMVALMLFYVQNSDGSEHKVNSWIRFLRGCIVFVIGCATITGIIESNFTRLSSDPTIDRQITEKKQAIGEADKNLDYYRDHNQTTRLAIESAKRDRLNRELDALNAKTNEVSSLGWGQILFLIAAKSVMICSNVTSVWLIGYLIRSGGDFASLIQEAVPRLRRRANA